MARFAAELGVSSAEVALARGRDAPGIASTLIGARTAEQRATLDELPASALGFPAGVLSTSARGHLRGGGDPGCPG